LNIADTVNVALRRIPSWVIYVVGVAHIVWLFWLGTTGGLGVEPIKALEQELGQTGLKLLLVVLAITPIRKFTGINLIRFRRAVGLTVFLYIAVHLTVWLVLDLQSVARIWADIVKRPYVTIGMLGFVLMVPLALTSNNWSVRKLGQKWRLLHKLTYAVVVLGALHFVMLVKGLQIEPLIYLTVALGLVALRVKRTKRSPRTV
jgi:sulfoxide reductase heme-binding subunit YedZ